MKKLIALGALVVVILLSYFLFGLAGLAVGAMIVAVAVISYRIAGATGLVRAVLLITLILSFVMGGLVGRARGPEPPEITKVEEIAFFVVGGAIGLMSWLAVVGSAFFLCSEIIFVLHGGDRWGSFVYLVTSLLLERAGAIEIVNRGEVRTIKGRGMLAPFKSIGYTIVYHGNAVVFERFGRPSRVAGPSLVLKKPLETIRAVVDLRMQVEARTPILCTKDGIPLTTYVRVLFQIAPGKRPPTRDDMYPFSEQAVLKAVYSVPDWKAYTIERATALLRDMVCRYYLEEIYDPLKKLSSRRGVDTRVHRLRDKLQDSLSETSPDWGVKIHKVELDITAPEEIEEQALALEKAKREEQIEYQKAEAENRRIKEFISHTGGDVTDYALLRYLERIGESGILPPSLDRMLLEAIEKGTSRPWREKKIKAGEEEVD
jgi:regulator of protease activity HflC (stomatin/prohibitin superfamily)